MKAVICTKYGAPDVFKIAEVAKPEPKDDEVCIKVYAAGVTASDIFIRSMNIPHIWERKLQEFAAHPIWEC